MRRKINPDRLTYTIGAVVDEQPLVNSIGVALANNEYEQFFEKGSGLPLKKRRDFKVIHALRQGQSGVPFKIPIVEGENALADRNRLNGSLEIRGEEIRRDLPVGSDIEVTLNIDTSRIITVKAYVPLLDQEFKTEINLQRREPNLHKLSGEKS